MSSWVALRRRVDFQPGQRVLILGATGNAGQMAVQVARHLGAGFIVAAGRDAERLAAVRPTAPTPPCRWPASRTSRRRARRSAADVDVVIDYLWGPPAARGDDRARPPPRRPRRAAALGADRLGRRPDVAVPSALLRAANLQILGSGQGSVSTAGIVAELPELAARLADGTLRANARTVPLSDVEQVWDAPARPGERVVFTP